MDWGGLAEKAGSILGNPLVGGILSTAGDLLANDQNKAEAERNRQFQERMSSTAVQRSVADYKAAGLNPGLAYERTASSPGGATANIGSASSGVTNARQASLQRAQLEMARQQNDADLRLKEAQTRKTGADEMASMNQAELNRANSLLAQQAMSFGAINQPHSTRILKADAIMKELGLTGAQNREGIAEMWQQLIRPGVSSAKGASKLMTDFWNKTKWTEDKK